MFVGVRSSIGFTEPDKTKVCEYVVAKDGTFEVRSSDIITSIKKVVKKVDAFPDMKESLTLNIPKIPFILFNQILSFFRKVYAAHKTESTIMIFKKKETGEFFLFVPKQENESAHSTYERYSDPAYQELVKDGQNVLVMVAHSHPWKATSVSPSGTDDNDEKEPILYMILSNVEATPVYCASTCPGGTRTKLNLFDIFENPLETSITDNNLLKACAQFVPEAKILETFCNGDMLIDSQWMTKISAKIRTTYSYGSRIRDYEDHYAGYSSYGDYGGYSGYQTGMVYANGKWDWPANHPKQHKQTKNTVNPAPIASIKSYSTKSTGLFSSTIDDILYDSSLDLTDIIRELEDKGFGNLIPRSCAKHATTSHLPNSTINI